MKFQVLQIFKQKKQNIAEQSELSAKLNKFKQGSKNVIILYLNM